MSFLIVRELDASGWQEVWKLKAVDILIKAEYFTTQREP